GHIDLVRGGDLAIAPADDRADRPVIEERQRHRAGETTHDGARDDRAALADEIVATLDQGGHYFEFDPASFGCGEPEADPASLGCGVTAVPSGFRRNGGAIPCRRKSRSSTSRSRSGVATTCSAG